MKTLQWKQRQSSGGPIIKGSYSAPHPRLDAYYIIRQCWDAPGYDAELMSAQTGRTHHYLGSEIPTLAAAKAACEKDSQPRVRPRALAGVRPERKPK
jgi:hypothetical protein